MPPKLTQETVEARCSANGFAWPKGVVFRKTQEKYPLICLTCGNDTPKWFSAVGVTGCKKCADVEMSLTHDEVVAQGLAAKHPAQLLDPYKVCMVKHRYLFFKCGHEWEITPHHLDNGHGCGVCWYDQGPTYVYLMERDGVLKIGITPVKPKLAKHSRIYKHSLDGFSLVHKEKHKTRKKALAREAAVLDLRNGGPALKPGEMRHHGEGETFFKDQVDVNQIIGTMK